MQVQKRAFFLGFARSYLLFILYICIVLAMANVEELGEEIASLAAHLDAATHRLLECIRQFDDAHGWHDQGALSCAHWLAWRTGLDTATAREKVRVARALGSLPAIDEALRQARLSYAKVRALTRVATPENEALLLKLALEATGAQLERLCRGYRSVLAADEAHGTRGALGAPAAPAGRDGEAGAGAFSRRGRPDPAGHRSRPRGARRTARCTQRRRPERGGAPREPPRRTFPRKRRGRRGQTGPWRWPSPSWPGTR